MHKHYSLLIIMITIPLGLPNIISHATPNASAYYYHDIVNLQDGLEFATGQGVTIAIVDSGIDLDHPSLSSNIWENTDEIANNFVDDDNNGYIDDVNGWDVMDDDNTIDHGTDSSHGTKIAGVIRQFAPDALIMPILFYIQTFQAIDTVTKLPEAIDYALDNGANVIVMSFGINALLSNNSYQAFQQAVDNNVTLVSATGNSYDNVIFYPAKYDNVIAVGAVDSSLNRAIWSIDAASNIGVGIDFVAGGTSISTTDVGGGTVSDDGTSYAAPIIASLAALLYELRSSITVAEVKGIMSNTAINLGSPGYDLTFGYGLVNYEQAVLVVNDLVSPIPITSEHSIHKSSLTDGFFYYSVSVQDESGIARCEFNYKLVTDSTYKTFTDCSGQPALVTANNSILTISINVSITTSLLSFYMILYDWTDKSLGIGNASHPIIIKTFLLDEVESTSESSESSDIQNSLSLSDPTSSLTDEEKGSTGDWRNREVLASNFLPISLFIFIMSFLALRRRRK